VTFNLSYFQKTQTVEGKCAGILELTMEARNRVEIGLARPTRLHKVLESVPWTRFLGFLKFKKTVSDVAVI
jgi:hypothetical protein